MIWVHYNARIIADKDISRLIIVEIIYKDYGKL